MMEDNRWAWVSFFLINSDSNMLWVEVIDRPTVKFNNVESLHKPLFDERGHQSRWERNELTGGCVFSGLCAPFSSVSARLVDESDCHTRYNFTLLQYQRYLFQFRNVRSSNDERRRRRWRRQWRQLDRRRFACFADGQSSDSMLGISQRVQQATYCVINCYYRVQQRQPNRKLSDYQRCHVAQAERLI